MIGVHWIDLPLAGRLGIMGRPRSGDWLEQEVDDWQRLGVESVVSLLDDDEAEELGLLQEAVLCHKVDIAFIRLPIPDRGVPESLSDVTSLCEQVARDVAQGKSVVVHCRAGIGRSALIAAGTLVTAGINVHKALDLISRARGLEVPDTEEQRNWILDFRPTSPEV